MSRKILLLNTPEEQERTKDLYREIFPEDTEAFLDFYYKKRPKRILAMEEDGVVIAPFSERKSRRAISMRWQREKIRESRELWGSCSAIAFSS